MKLFVKKPALLALIFTLAATADARVYSPGVAQNIVETFFREKERTGTIKDLPKFKQAFQDMSPVVKTNYQDDYEQALKSVEKMTSKTKPIGLPITLDTVNEKTGKIISTAIVPGMMTGGGVLPQKNTKEEGSKKEPNNSTNNDKIPDLIDEEVSHEKQLKGYQIGKERLEKERLEKERLEKERLEKERIEKERIEKERLEKEKIEKEKLEIERLKKIVEEEQRLEKERQEKERLERERQEKERIEKERIEKEKQEKERLEKEKLEKQRLEEIEKKRIEKERLEKERLEKEKIEKEELEKEQLEKIKSNNGGVLLLEDKAVSSFKTLTDAKEESKKCSPNSVIVHNQLGKKVYVGLYRLTTGTLGLTLNRDTQFKPVEISENSYKPICITRTLLKNYKLVVLDDIEFKPTYVGLPLEKLKEKNRLFDLGKDYINQLKTIDIIK